MAESLRQQLERRLSELRQERNTFLPHWQELTKFLSPRTGKYLVIETNKGSKANDSIINSCATTALRTLKSGMHAGMTSQSRPWFRLTTEDADLMKSSAVKQWLFDVENKMRIIFARSNFYNVMPQIYGATGGHGTAAMAILDDHESIIRCFPFPVGSFMLALNDRLKCDTLYREFPMTVRQMASSFGLDNLSVTVRSLWDNGSYEQKIPVVHAIEPNLERDAEKMNSKNKPYRSIYYESGSSEPNKFLRESGFDEFPVMAPRWDVEGDDVYGYSPGMDALGLVKGLQFTEKSKAKVVDQIARPAMIADSLLRTERTSILAGDITYITNLSSMAHPPFRRAFETDSRAIPELRNDIEAIKQEIKHIMFEDLMMMFATSDVSDITAREVEERHQEKLLVLGPTIERFGEELYDPAIDRTFAIMMRRGLVSKPPTELQGQNLKIEYISIMAQAQKLIGTASMERVTGYVGNIANFNPEAIDKLNVDAAIDEYASMHGIPPNVIRTNDEVTGIRRLKAKQQRMQQLASAVPMVSDAATAARTLSETKVDETNALTRLLGAG